jgi:TonB family protein
MAGLLPLVQASGRALRHVGVCAVLATALVACGDSGKNEIKALKEQVQRATGQRDYARVLEASQKGFTLAQSAMGDKAPDTLYFAQGITEGYRAMHNTRLAMSALKREISLRAGAGQAEKKLQARRTLLIQMAEENGDRLTAADQAVAVSRGIDMGPDKNPQPVYQVSTDYPAALFQQKVEGDVEIAYSLDSNGSVIEAHALKATAQAFEQPALESFRKWRFTPMLNEKREPVSKSGLRFTMAFRLGNQR